VKDDEYTKKVLNVYKKLEKSMVGFEVNGNPEKRRMFLLNLASYIVVRKFKNKLK